MNSSRTLATLFIVCCGLAQSSFGVILDYTFSGTLTQSDFGSHKVGEQFTGAFTINYAVEGTTSNVLGFNMSEFNDLTSGVINFGNERLSFSSGDIRMFNSAPDGGQVTMYFNDNATFDGRYLMSKAVDAIAPGGFTQIASGTLPQALDGSPLSLMGGAVRLSTLNSSGTGFMSLVGSIQSQNVYQHTPRTFGLAMGVKDDVPTRGDLDARAIYTALSSLQGWATPDYGNTTAAIELDEATEPFTDTMTRLNTSLDRMNVQPGDTVVFYYAGHTYTQPIGDEPLNYTKDYQLSSQFGPDQMYWSNGDEELATPGGYISDNRLASLFSSAKWTDVNKIFILDSCSSGGFIGGPNDLQILNNWALFAAAAEGQETHQKYSGRGIFTNKVVLPILQTSGLSLSQLKSRIEESSGDLLAEYGNQLLPIRGTGYPTGLSEFSYNPVVAYSENLETFSPFTTAATPVPEPSFYGLSALAILSIGIGSRRRLGVRASTKAT